jgi:hypothetical protein
MKIVSIMIAAVLLPITGSVPADARTVSPQDLRAIAQCSIEQDAKSVGTLLGTLPGSDAEARAAARLVPVYTACSGDNIGLAIRPGTQSLYNGRAGLAAAAAALALDQGRGNISNAAIASPWYVLSIRGLTAGRDYDGVSLGMQEFGTCVVKAAPDASARLVRSSAGGDDERQALDGIRPVLAGCLVQGRPIHMKLDQLRLMVAEPLYHVLVDGPSAGRRS